MSKVLSASQVFQMSKGKKFISENLISNVSFFQKIQRCYCAFFCLSVLQLKLSFSTLRIMHKNLLIIQKSAQNNTNILLIMCVNF